MVDAMQPLTALQQLKALTFTRCEYGTATALPYAAMATLGRLVALDALDCGMFEFEGDNWFPCSHIHRRDNRSATLCLSPLCHTK